MNLALLRSFEEFTYCELVDRISRKITVNRTMRLLIFHCKKFVRGTHISWMMKMFQDIYWKETKITVEMFCMWRSSKVYQETRVVSKFQQRIKEVEFISQLCNETSHACSSYHSKTTKYVMCREAGASGISFPTLIVIWGQRTKIWDICLDQSQICNTITHHEQIQKSLHQN